MKKLKSIDFKALFVNHGEKFGLGLMLLLVLLALSSTSWSRYAGTPEDLDKKAKDARQRFTSTTGNPWPKEKAESFKVVDFTDRAGQLFARLDLPRYEFTTPLSYPLYRKRELAREPEYLPVEYLVAHAGRAILGISPVGAATDSTVVDAGTGTVSEATTTTAPTGNRFKSSSPLGGAGGSGGAAGFPGPAAGHAGMGAGAHSGSAGAHAGAGMYSGMPGMGGAPSGVAARGVRYVAVRGVFPLQQQMVKYVSALNVMSAEASTMFELLDFVLERQAAVAGPNPWATEWETVNVESALEVLREASDFELDPVQTGVTDSVITMSLPYRLLEFWGDNATHPNIRDFQLKPEEMERELRLQEKLLEEYEKAKLQSEPKIKRRGLSAGQNDLRQMGQQMMAMPSSAHMMTGMANSMMTESGSGGAGGPRMTAADIKQRLTANGRLLLFRYFDFDVQPGLAYRYRVKLKIRNPNFERAAAEVVSPELAQGAERETPWSNISMPAVVPTSVAYFLKDVDRDPSRDDKFRANKPVANISMFEWDTKLGTMLHDTLKILNVGQFISEKKKSIVLDVATPSYKEDEDVPFLTGDVLLDASGDFEIVPDQHPDLGLRADKGRSNFKLGLLPEALVMTGLGEMRELNPASEKSKEQALKQRVDAERSEVKKMTEAAAPASGMMEGSASNAYDAMMGSAAASGMQKPPGKKSPKKKGSDMGSSSAGAHSAPESGGGKPKSKRSMPAPP
jgi:hypothetical protein